MKNNKSYSDLPSSRPLSREHLKTTNMSLGGNGEPSREIRVRVSTMHRIRVRGSGCGFGFCFGLAESSVEGEPHVAFSKTFGVESFL